MDILIFLGGFLLGAVVVFIPFFILGKKDNSKLLADQMKLEFENLANRIFDENSQKITEQNREKLDNFFRMFKEKIEDFEKKNADNLEKELLNLTVFDKNIKNFIEAGNKISERTISLENTMKADNRKQGKWGEIVLEKVLEASGLRVNEEYKIQSGISDGRPDVVVYLPEGKQVYIDAKTSLSSWSGYVNAEDETEREKYKKMFFNSTKTHITGLAKRDYSKEDVSPDYVLMFIPIESCYSLFFCEECELWDLAWANKIMPVSPSTLLASLKIINAFFIIDRQNKNTKKITDTCSSMIDKFSDLLKDLQKIQSLFDDVIRKLDGKGNIINQLKNIEKWGAKGTKTIPDLSDEK